MKRLLLGLVAVALLATSCRDDVGDPDYSGLQPVFDRIKADAGAPLPGPDPYVPGERRLALGLFYEGAASEVVQIDGASSNYFIFLAGNVLTYSQAADTTERVEGAQSDRITLAGTSFWGGGVIWGPTRDLSTWRTLAVSIKSNEIEVVNITLGSSSKELGLAADKYGYAPDGQWHNLRIPLADYVAGGVDLADIKVAFAIGAAGGKAGQEILVDNVYFE